MSKFGNGTNTTSAVTATSSYSTSSTAAAVQQPTNELGYGVGKLARKVFIRLTSPTPRQLRHQKKMRGQAKMVAKAQRAIEERKSDERRTVGRELMQMEFPENFCFNGVYNSNICRAWRIQEGNEHVQLLYGVPGSISEGVPVEFYNYLGTQFGRITEISVNMRDIEGSITHHATAPEYFSGKFTLQLDSVVGVSQPYVDAVFTEFNVILDEFIRSRQVAPSPSGIGAAAITCITAAAAFCVGGMGSLLYWGRRRANQADEEQGTNSSVDSQASDNVTATDEERTDNNTHSVARDGEEIDPASAPSLIRSSAPSPAVARANREEGDVLSTGDDSIFVSFSDDALSSEKELSSSDGFAVAVGRKSLKPDVIAAVAAANNREIS